MNLEKLKCWHGVCVSDGVVETEGAGDSHSAKLCLEKNHPMLLFIYLIPQKSCRHHPKLLHCLCLTRLLLQLIWINNLGDILLFCAKLYISLHHSPVMKPSVAL